MLRAVLATVVKESSGRSAPLSVDFNHIIPYLACGDEPHRARCPLELLCLLLVVQLNEVLDRCLEILDGITDALPKPFVVECIFMATITGFPQMLQNWDTWRMVEEDGLRTAIRVAGGRCGVVKI